MATIKPETVSVPITLPCGCSTTLNLVRTGINSHVAIITAHSIHHRCFRSPRFSKWQLHLFGYLTPAKFSRLDQLGIEFPQTPEEPCPTSK